MSADSKLPSYRERLRAELSSGHPAPKEPAMNADLRGLLDELEDRAFSPSDASIRTVASRQLKSLKEIISLSQGGKP